VIHQKCSVTEKGLRKEGGRSYSAVEQRGLARPEKDPGCEDSGLRGRSHEPRSDSYSYNKEKEGALRRPLGKNTKTPDDPLEEDPWDHWPGASVEEKVPARSWDRFWSRTPWLPGILRRVRVSPLIRVGIPVPPCHWMAVL
jgi:hypothetical protein